MTETRWAKGTAGDLVALTSCTLCGVDDMATAGAPDVANKLPTIALMPKETAGAK